jgi:maltose/moltooligosaccharide transporter
VRVEYTKIFALAFMLFATQAMWTVYNKYIPAYFAALGLGAAMAGAVVAWEKAAGIVLEPFAGRLSDGVKRRVARRLGWILVPAFAAALCMSLIPDQVDWSPEALRGQPAARTYARPFGVAVLFLLLAMALFRAPVVALMPDLVPARHRDTASGVFNLMTTMGGRVADHAGSWLVRLSPGAPFWAAAGVLALAAAVLARSVSRAEPAPARAEPDTVAAAPSPRHVGLLILASTAWLFAFSGFQAILPSHLKQSLPAEAAAAANVLPAFLTSYAIFSVPAAFAVQHWGRKPIMLGGLGTVLASYLLIHTASSIDLVLVLANVAGLGWALVNTPALPMMLEAVPAGRHGLFAGLYYVGANVVGFLAPTVNPWIAASFSDWFGTAYFAPAIFLGLATAGVAFMRPEPPRAETP